MSFKRFLSPFIISAVFLSILSFILGSYVIPISNKYRINFENKYIKNDIPDFSSGDTIKVSVRVTEGSRERIQIFEGIVIAINGDGINKTITVRKVSFGIGVERIFPVHAPIVSSIEVLKKGKVRRSKLYYLRDRIGKSAKIKEDR